MSDESESVVLIQGTTANPRPRKKKKRPETVQVRVVFSISSKTVSVETEIGLDALGIARWRRIDRRKTRGEIECAHAQMALAIASLYNKALSAEEKIRERERVKSFARPMPFAPFQRPVDSSVKKKLDDLMSLANSGSSNESRNAAKLAVDLLAKHPELLR